MKDLELHLVIIAQLDNLYMINNIFNLKWTKIVYIVYANCGKRLVIANK